ncbi:MAG: hypothetical protein BBJ57_09485 [Desulfobacterales bacterium PC51MH44]|nr:MAG: hypothetical protein BBJ57_09485 [Desulfobacterales bacterium PC51MH44]
MNILFVSHYPDAHTGSPRALIDFVGNMDRKFFQQCLMVPKKGALSKELEQYGTRIFTKVSISLSQNNLPEFIASVISFLSLYHKEKIDLVHYNGIGWRESCLLAAWLLRIPIVLYLHNPYPQDEISGNFNFYFANSIIAVSQFMRDNFKNHPKIMNKIVCIHNGVDLGYFISKPSTMRETLGIDDQTFVIGFVGQISTRKGLDTLIHTSPSIIEQHPDTVFLIVGSDGAGEEGLTAKMKRLAERLGVLQHFYFLGRQTDIPEVMNTIDLLVTPSLAEPFGKVIIEAMGCRKCVIASRVDGIPEIIQDGKNGLLVPPKNVNALGSAILKLMENEKLRIQLAETGYKTAVEEFAIDKHVKKVQGLYTQLLTQKRTG